MRAGLHYSILMLVLTAAGCSDDVLAPGTPEQSAARESAPVFLADADRAIAGRWIVVLDADAGPAATAAAAFRASAGVRAERVFDAGLRGFVAQLDADAVERLRAQPGVAYIEQDARVAVASFGMQSWNLRRIGQVRAPLGAGTVGADGAGVHAYVIDTGVRVTHEELDGRATHAFDAVDGGAAEDCNGHGTHVAATLGGETQGVAPGVSIVAVRVLDCGGTGTVSDVLAGIDWVTANHVKPAVANLSIAGAGSRAVDDADARAVAAGVVLVVAAGNDARDACGYSPARSAPALTVGATTQSDAVWALSNQGSCVDLFAPGDAIESAWHTGDRASMTLSGTSMAAPHVAGAVALRLQRTPNATPAEIERALLHGAASGQLERLASGSPDLLLQLDADPTWEDVRDWTR